MRCLHDFQGAGSQGFEAVLNTVWVIFKGSGSQGFEAVRNTACVILWVQGHRDLRLS